MLGELGKGERREMEGATKREANWRSIVGERSSGREEVVEGVRAVGYCLGGSDGLVLGRNSKTEEFII
jgi:hypothetical protein